MPRKSCGKTSKTKKLKEIRKLLLLKLSEENHPKIGGNYNPPSTPVCNDLNTLYTIKNLKI